MKTNVIKIDGLWDLGFVIDRQISKSHFLGYDANGNAQFDTERTEIGEALFQLKYRNDFSQVGPLADTLVKELAPIFSSTNIVIPMPASKTRGTQPVYELAKSGTTAQMKDLKNEDEKLSSLRSTLSFN